MAVPPTLEIISHFQQQGEFLEAAAYGTGHINDTFASRFRTDRGVVRYIHQRINHHVFREPVQVMENIVRVTRYAAERIRAAGGDPARETLTVIPALDGRPYYRTADGDYWRTYVFIEGARTYDQVEEVRHVYTAANAFGNFQRLLAGLPGERLHETIPGFHHTAQAVRRLRPGARSAMRTTAPLRRGPRSTSSSNGPPTRASWSICWPKDACPSA